MGFLVALFLLRRVRCVVVAIPSSFRVVVCVFAKLDTPLDLPRKLSLGWFVLARTNRSIPDLTLHKFPWDTFTGGRGVRLNCCSHSKSNFQL